MGIATAVIAAVAVVLVLAARPLARRRFGDDDPYRRYWAVKLVTYGITALAIVAVLVLWAPLGGRLTFILGLATAGLAFGMQQVVGALFGWVNILSGRIFQVGDRIEISQVRGDVIDLTPLRTKVLEIGLPGPPPGQRPQDGPATWVHGRQYTGRIVTISNQATFTGPVYNYSATFDYIWEELTFPIPYRCDWRRADAILLEEAQRVSSDEGAREAMEAVRDRYPLPSAEIGPRVFARATDNWMELSARFVLPVRRARSVKDEMTRRIMDRLEELGIDVASSTSEVTVRLPDGAALGEARLAPATAGGGESPAGGAQS